MVLSGGNTFTFTIQRGDDIGARIAEHLKVPRSSVTLDYIRNEAEVRTRQRRRTATMPTDYHDRWRRDGWAIRSFPVVLIFIDRDENGFALQEMQS